MNIFEILKKSYLVFDGGMGTYYQEKTKSTKKCEFANLDEEDIIYNIHREYILAGCDAIKTNTFAANPYSLNCDFETVSQIIKKGYEIAAKAAGKNAFVFADIGPIPPNATKDPFKVYKEIVDIFLSMNAKYFLFETLSSDENLYKISKYIKKKAPDSFIIASFAVSPEGLTREGLSGKVLFERTCQNPYVDCVGFNCISGAYHLLKYIKNFDLTKKYVSVMPNAGYPTVIDNRTYFENNPVYFSDKMAQLARAGVKVLGGCCGTTPEFIKYTINNLKYLPEEKSAEPKISIAAALEKKHENILIEKMNKGQKVIAVELDPPVDTDISFFLKGAEELTLEGADAITIADCPIARARVDSSLLACKLKREKNINTIPHMTCRDRNINATKALLLGLNIEGVENVLVVTGDPIPNAQRDEIKTMFAFNSAILAGHIKTLNETVFQKPFTIFAALNVNSKNFDHQLAHAQKKIENGVSVFLTQPVFTEEALKNLKRAKENLDAKILCGILPIVSYNNANFINNEISGITVSESIIERYKGISKEEASKLAVEISLDIINAAKDYCDGYYLITPFKRIDIIKELIREIKKM
ncbi:MAG: bifunctional homocysteine S-methyltransferase/methylenetetrahydrofolate reductase [Clostridiaceae bacterium]|nr:bifunctional homocysteine S-methyltransferase/methylenetetrahydrofolate reductase [Clostridiaceae bacterium]